MSKINSRVVFRRSKTDSSRGWIKQSWIQVDKIGNKYEVIEYDFTDVNVIGTFNHEKEAVKFAETA